MTAAFDVLAWHQACAEHGLVLDRFTAPAVGSVTELHGAVGEHRVTAWLFRGVATLWVMMRCSTCDRDVTLAQGQSGTTEVEIVAAVAAEALGPKCDWCRAADHPARRPIV